MKIELKMSIMVDGEEVTSARSDVEAMAAKYQFPFERRRHVGHMFEQLLQFTLKAAEAEEDK